MENLPEKLSPTEGSATDAEMVKRAESYVETFCSLTDNTCGEVSTRFHAAVLLSEVRRLRTLASELLEMVEEYHACDWEEEPFTPDLDELHRRLSLPNIPVSRGHSAGGAQGQTRARSVEHQDHQFGGLKTS